MVLDRLRRRFTWDGTAGAPRSANGASSFHLPWVVPQGDWVAAEAVLEVLEAPAVPALHFWALQVSFTDRGRDGGGAHLGLQWYPAHPGSTAANWGGYRAGGGELPGSVSELASATGNVNTRDFPWQPRRPYRLRVSRAGPAGPDSTGSGSADPGSAGPDGGATAWRGQVIDDVSGRVTTVRDLWAPGTHLSAPMVWSEVFARCDDEGCRVRWSRMSLWREDGSVHRVATVGVNYQPLGAGGCATTNSAPDELGIVQQTGTQRITPPDARLQVPGSPSEPR